MTATLTTAPPASQWLRLHPADNVGCLLRSFRKGDPILVEGLPIVLDRDLGLGHKIALCDIQPGERILKFGFPIGSATAFIAAGDHVHTHNLKSDYLPTYTLHQGATFGR